MDLRDQFAIAALPGVMKIMDKFAKDKNIIVEYDVVAETAYLYADAMMRERVVKQRNK